MTVDRDNYCKDCKRSIYGEDKDCDVNIENNGKMLWLERSVIAK